ncbi:hypothetical protein BTR23_15970 [Alkalihalophilus pseudofirmus]|nr:hypothetical protein BTR23_15970 [Alkalihalophilus pseudofirmus]
MVKTTMQAIEAYFNNKLLDGKNVRITDFNQPSAGWSDEAFTFTVVWEQEGKTLEKGYAIRKQNKGGLMTEYQDAYRHFKLLDRLSKNSDLPIPGVHWYETDEDILGGTFFVMDKLPGKSYVPWSKEGQLFFKQAHEDGEIPLQFVRHLADLHLIDFKEIGLAEDLVEPFGPFGYIDSKIEEFEEMYNKYQISPDPIMVDALEWLKLNKPAAQRLSVVHGDYRSGNLLYSNNQITGILDWEATEIGDPMADVAYVCAKSNRMDSPLLNYLLDKKMFLETYSEFTGLTIEEKVLHYYEVFHQVRFVLISQSAGTDFAKSKTKDLRMARQGYRWPLMRGILAELLDY